MRDEKLNKYATKLERLAWAVRHKQPLVFAAVHKDLQDLWSEIEHKVWETNDARPTMVESDTTP